MELHTRPNTDSSLSSHDTDYKKVPLAFASSITHIDAAQRDHTMEVIRSMLTPRPVQIEMLDKTHLTLLSFPFTPRRETTAPVPQETKEQPIVAEQKQEEESDDPYIRRQQQLDISSETSYGRTTNVRRFIDDDDSDVKPESPSTAASSTHSESKTPQIVKKLEIDATKTDNPQKWEKLSRDLFHQSFPSVEFENTRDLSLTYENELHPYNIRIIFVLDRVLDPTKGKATSEVIRSQSYRLSVEDAHSIKIESHGEAGLFYGMQTLHQLMMLCRTDKDDIIEQESQSKKTKTRRSSLLASPTFDDDRHRSSSTSSEERSRNSQEFSKSELQDQEEEEKLFLSFESVATHTRTRERMIEKSVIEGLPVSLQIIDYPSFEQRGLMLDISRNRVPKMETLYKFVEQISRQKMNHLQLYMEHTFMYEGHDPVWKDASPISPQEIRELDAFCKERFVELVPNQNSLGHFHKWLVVDEYRHLAEVPEGIHHPFSFVKEPFSLATNQNSLEFLKGLYDQLLPNFSSRQFNVGLDEVFDLGKGASSSRMKKEDMYIQFLRNLYKELNVRGYHMMFWADMICQFPRILDQVPKNNTTALLWNYEADTSFEKNCQLLESHHLDFFVCPGTSSWNSIGGRVVNSIQNMRNAAAAGARHHARGYLITDWGDNGHLQQGVVSSLPIYIASCFSWNAASAETDHSLKQISSKSTAKVVGPADQLQLMSLLASMNRFVFQDYNQTTANVLFDIGTAYKVVDWDVPSGSIIFWPFIFPAAIQHYSAVKALMQEKFGKVGSWLWNHCGKTVVKTVNSFIGFNSENLEKTIYHLDTARIAFESKSQMQCEDAELLKKEILFTIDFLKIACRVTLERSKIGLDKDVSELKPDVKAKLAEQVQELIPRFRELWLAESREGGLEASVLFFTNLLNKLQEGK